jgi:hypothetical protein
MVSSPFSRPQELTLLPSFCRVAGFAGKAHKAHPYLDF